MNGNGILNKPILSCPAIERCREFCKEHENTIILTPRRLCEPCLLLSNDILQLLGNASYIVPMFNWSKRLFAIIPADKDDKCSVSIQYGDDGIGCIWFCALAINLYTMIDSSPDTPYVLHACRDRNCARYAIIVDFSKTEAISLSDENGAIICSDVPSFDVAEWKKRLKSKVMLESYAMR